MFVTPTININCITCTNGDHDEEEGGYKNQSAAGTTKPDLYGGLTGGGAWDDGIFDGITAINLVYGTYIDSMCVTYIDTDGKQITGETHGGIEHGMNRHNEPLRPPVEIKMEYPDEFLVSVSGHYHGVTWLRDNPKVLHSLKFETNRRTLGPYGVQVGTHFAFRVKEGEKIVGFKGTSGWYLDAIGFHVSRAPKRDLFRRVRNGFSKAYESLIKITKPLIN